MLQTQEHFRPDSGLDTPTVRLHGRTKQIIIYYILITIYHYILITREDFNIKQELSSEKFYKRIINTIKKYYNVNKWSFY